MMENRTPHSRPGKAGVNSAAVGEITMRQVAFRQIAIGKIATDSIAATKQKPFVQSIEAFELVLG